MNSPFEFLSTFPSWLLLIFGATLVLATWAISSFVLSMQRRRGLSLSDAKDEMEIRKAFFTIVGMIGIFVTVAFTASEVSVAIRAENREQLYAALGQLAESNASSPEVSAAALLQLRKLGEASPDDLPALVRVVNAYLTANAQSPVADHNVSDVTRPDIEVAMLVLSGLVAEDPKLGSLVRLKGLDLRFLRGADLFLPQARLIEVDLSGATLQRADFSEAEFVNVKIENGNFSGVAVNGATLRGLILDGTPHSGTDFCVSSVEARRVMIDGKVSWTAEECGNG